MKKYVYLFEEVNDPSASLMLLGNKGAQLAEMVKIGLPVPPGFTISTEACNEFYSLGKKWPTGLEGEVKQKVSELEAKLGKKFNSKDNPLLVSVRSGSYVSMPGMMDTVLNLGMNDETVLAFAKKTNNERLAWDSYRRFLQMFGDVVLGVEHHSFEEILAHAKQKKGVKLDTDLDANDLKDVAQEYKKLIREKTGKDFPQNPEIQLEGAINAVFNSWNNKRAITYRKLNGLRDDAGTGVTVQAMVFGNTGERSGTGVGFTRNPSTGEREMYGEFLINAQGEDVVAGIRTPYHIDEMQKILPKSYGQIRDVFQKLEGHFRDMQDVEFTIEDDKLFMLQTRNGKRTAKAAVRIATDMMKEGAITKQEAVMRVNAQQLDQLLHNQVDEKAKKGAQKIAKGLAASPGAAVGQVVFDADKAAELKEKDPQAKLILVRRETRPEDIAGMNAAQGILTSTGGLTCIGGGSSLLTKDGFFTAEELFTRIENGEKPQILSFNSGEMKTNWKNIIAAGKRKRFAIKANVSQSGRVRNNSLVITPDHKMMVIKNRKLEKKPLENVFNNSEFVSVVDKIPCPKNPDFNTKYAYLAGAIFTDGYIKVKPTKGQVTFTQKKIPEKLEFINTVNQYFYELFGESMGERVKHTLGYLRGRKIEGTASDFSCYKKAPAIALMQTRENMVPWVLGLNEIETLNFLAGVADGDGAFYENRLQLYIGKEALAQGVVIACLKLGIVPQVCRNRTIYNIQIVERLADIILYTKRASGKTPKKRNSAKLFAMRQTFEDIIEKVNFKGHAKSSSKRNVMHGADKIAKDILPFVDNKTREETLQVINSDLRMQRISKECDIGEIDVYNFEVDSNNELDKNFVVFTSRYTPVLVSNSHAAVVARGMGKCCVVGAGEVNVDPRAEKMTCGNCTVRQGEWITVDGSTGEVFVGQLGVVKPTMGPEFKELMQWADEFRTLKVRTNADTPKDSQVARDFGAEGIGLCRTEHMFFDAERINAVRQMIIADNRGEREKALAKIEPMQKEDFIGIFKAMDGLPVTIRLLDPPLHEFLPKNKREIDMVAQELGITFQKLKTKVKALKEQNPMLGFRGCRLGIIYPEINEMQVRAIMEAACECKKAGVKVIPEIMIPVLQHVNEMKDMHGLVKRTADAVLENKKIDVQYTIGVMMELPRACITADEIAEHAQFFSFGTNDLTQTTLGFSRDDVGKFIPAYIEKKIMEFDPFQRLDEAGVGELIKMSVEKGRRTRKDLKIGICGEHGGEPHSIDFCHRNGLNYVSCSPYRVPTARLAAAQSALRHGKK